MIEKTILAEEHRFETVLVEGLPRLEAEIAKVIASGARVLPGEAAFRLYDTFGIPSDFIEDTAATSGVSVDKAGVRRRDGGTARQGARAERVRRARPTRPSRRLTRRRSRTPAIGSRATRPPA